MYMYNLYMYMYTCKLLTYNYNWMSLESYLNLQKYNRLIQLLLYCLAGLSTLVECGSSAHLHSITMYLKYMIYQ